MHHPRRLWLRRALFQVHLWLGVLLSLYVAVIGLSGSLLVFDEEFHAYALRDLHYDPSHLASAQQVMEQAVAKYPGTRVSYLMWPQAKSPAFSVYLRDAKRDRNVVLADAATGAVLPERKMFMETVRDLHVYLLMGHTGFVINCVAGMGLLVLAMTGMVLWWPGLRLWFRGLFFSLRHGWKRINYDAHSAIGIWTLLIVSWWGMTSIYFLWPDAVTAAVNVVSPLRGMKRPDSPKAEAGTQPVDVNAVVAHARALHPDGFLSGILLPAASGGNVIAYTDVRKVGDFNHRAIDTFASDGRLLTTWRYGENKTAGDWVVWLMNPLHFGTTWGLGVKVLWSLLGLSLPLLSTTGLLMYWNRYLGKRWRAMSNRA